MAPQLVERGCERFKVGRENESTWVGLALADQPRPIDHTVAMGRVGRRIGSNATLATLATDSAEQSETDALSPLAEANGSQGSRPTEELF
jgi:hypothetical protein